MLSNIYVTISTCCQVRQQVDTWDCSPAPQPIYYTDITPRTVQVTETVNTLQN